MDIHGGGFDLRFPHHDNELAQSEVGLLSAGGLGTPSVAGEVGGLSARGHSVGPGPWRVLSVGT